MRAGLSFEKILAVPCISHVDCLALSELGCFEKMCVKLDFEKAYSYNPDPVSVTRGIFWAWPFTGSSHFLLIWYFFNPRGWWNFPWLCQVLAIPCLLLNGLSSYARRWVICTNLCGVDLWKILFVQPWCSIGPQRNSGLDYSLGLPCFPDYGVFNPRGW